MKILVFEFMIGGGVSDQHPLGVNDLEFLKQGRSMLEPVCEDFLALGHDLIVPVDSNLSLSLSQPVTQITISHPQQLAESLKSAAQQVDTILVIAPETDGIFWKIVSSLESAGSEKFLMPSAEFIKLAGDKWECWRHFSATSVPVPSTWLCKSLADAEPYFDSSAGPLVIKPIDGAGSEGVALVHAAAKIAAMNPSEPFLLQEFVSGDAVSIVCAGSVDGSIEFLEPGRQIFDCEPCGIHIETRFPLPDDLRNRTTSLARQTVAALPPFRGFIGLDMVLGETVRQDCLIEVNPRLTATYRYLREFCGVNLAEKLLAAI